MEESLCSQHPLLLPQKFESSATWRLWQPQLPLIGHSFCANGDSLIFYGKLHEASEVDAKLYRSGNQSFVRLPLAQHGGYRIRGAGKGSPRGRASSLLVSPHLTHRTSDLIWTSLPRTSVNMKPMLFLKGTTYEFSLPLTCSEILAARKDSFPSCYHG